MQPLMSVQPSRASIKPFLVTAKGFYSSSSSSSSSVTLRQLNPLPSYCASLSRKADPEVLANLFGSDFNRVGVLCAAAQQLLLPACNQQQQQQHTRLTSATTTHLSEISSSSDMASGNGELIAEAICQNSGVCHSHSLTSQWND